MLNMRLRTAPKTVHEDFEYARGMPSGERVEENKKWRRLKQRIDSKYFDTSFCFWGAVGKMSEPDSSAPGNVFYIRYINPIAEKVFRNFMVKEINEVSAGALQLTNDDLIRIYEITKSQIKE